MPSKLRVKLHKRFGGFKSDYYLRQETENKTYIVRWITKLLRLQKNIPSIIYKYLR